MARRIRFEGSRATGVEVESGGERFTVEGNEIVLSGGAIGSPQALLLSGVGPADHLKSMGISVVRDSPGVGQNLRDHPSVDVLFRAAGERPDLDAPVIQVGLRYTTEDSTIRNDIQITPYTQVQIDDDKNYIGMEVGLQLAMGSGELKLSSVDPGVQPYLDYNYLTDPRDRERLRKAIRLAIRLGEHPAFEDIILERVNPTDADLASDDTLDAWMSRNVGTSHHISGTCKMGPDTDPMAVVDQFGRVRGVDGLRVADASVMPDVIRANTNATAIMIGERVAEWIAQGR